MLPLRSRTWTPAPDGIGTLGQGITGIPWRGGDLLDDEKVLVGLESSEDFRTNLGLVNPTFDYIETFYNRRRLHSALDYRTPAAVEAEYDAAA